MPRASQKRKKNNSGNPSGPVAKPQKGSKVHDDTRVVHAEEPNRDDG